jgi:hypothetical protein
MMVAADLLIAACCQHLTLFFQLLRGNNSIPLPPGEAPWNSANLALNDAFVSGALGMGLSSLTNMASPGLCCLE